MRIVVTGGAGFLGRVVLQQLQQEFPAASLVCADQQVPAASENAFSYRQVDIRDPEAVKNLLRQADIVVHTAAVVDVNLFAQPLVWQVNRDGTRNLLQAAQQAGVELFVHTSTMDVAFDGLPHRNDVESKGYPAKPMNDYIASKIAAEKMALEAHDPDGMRTVAIRPTGIYGPNDNHRGDVIRTIITKGMPIRLGDRESVFDHVYVDNVAHAHVCAVRAWMQRPERITGRAYFVGDHENGNFFAFMAAMIAVLGIELPDRYMGLRLSLLLATVTEWSVRFFRIFWRNANTEITRYSVLSIGQDLTFSWEQLRKDLDYMPIVDQATAHARTREWILQAFAQYNKNTSVPVTGPEAGTEREP